MRALWRWLTSIKLSAALIAVMAALMLAAVALPQEHLVGAEGIRAAAGDSAAKRFLLITLGLGDIASSWLFIAALGAFLVNLSAVLIKRTRATFVRIRPREQSAAQLHRRAGRDDAVRLERPAGWDPKAAGATLRRLGYRVTQPGKDCMFGEKNRTGLLGFLVFHLSFFPICAGGLLIYYTRYDARVLLTEGQPVRGAFVGLVRQPPIGPPPRLDFRLSRVTPHIEGGHRLQLELAFEIETNDGPVQKTAIVNRPASVGHTDLLVDQVGVAPVFTVLDASGIAIDTMALPAPANRGSMTLSPMADAAFEIELDPFPIGPAFPMREQLATTAIGLRAFGETEELYAGTLRPGELARVGDLTLRLDEVRYWAAVHMVRERGGWLLIAGFALAVIGLVWRMLFVRREVGVVWYPAEVVLVGRTEFYRNRLRADLEAIGALIVEQSAAPVGEDELS